MGIGKIKFIFAQLLSLGAFLGHTIRRRNNFMSLYFYGIRCGMICFNLSYTSYNMRRASSFFLDSISHRGSGFFLAGNLRVINLWFHERIAEIKKVKKSCCWFAGPYIGGLVSNFDEVKRNVVARRCSNMINFRRLPSIVLVFDSNEYFNSFREAYSLGTPSVGLVDSDLEYQDISYPIFMNNETFRIKFFFCNFFFLLIVYQKLIEKFLLLNPKEKIVDNREKIFSRIISKNYKNNAYRRYIYRRVNPILLRFFRKYVNVKIPQYVDQINVKRINFRRVIWKDGLLVPIDEAYKKKE